MEEILVDSDIAFGRVRDVSCESWLESEVREREYTEFVRDDLKELSESKQDSGFTGVGDVGDCGLE